MCDARSAESKSGDQNIPYGPERKPWKDTLSSVAVSLSGKLLVSPPSRDPLSEYSDVVSKVTGWFYQVPSQKLSGDQQDQAQKETLDVLNRQVENFVGYQVDQYMPELERLSPFLCFHSNNIGDPFTAGTMTTNTKWMECNVLDYYASLWNGKWPYKLEDPDTYWGYVLTMGSTEGNLYAAWNARDYLSGKYLYYNPTGLHRALKEIRSKAKRIASIPYGFTYGQARLAKRTASEESGEQNENAFSPVVFYSEDAHYSNIKATQTIDIPTFYSVGVEKYPNQCPLPNSGGEWPAEVPSKDGALGPGTVDVEALAILVDFFTAKGHPAYIVLNYGATFKGTYDNVELVGTVLTPILRKNGMYTRDIVLEDGSTETRQGFWIHVDGALGASYMPFIRMAAENSLREGMKPGPQFDFQLDFVTSIVTSGHKWIGSPAPCGVYLMRNNFRIKPPDNTPIYIGSPDTTFAGSRNALSCAVLWTYISTHSYEEQVQKVLHCVDVAKYAYMRLKKLETDLEMDLWVTHSNEYSLSLYFKKPNDDIVYKYSMSSENLLVEVDGVSQERQYSHIYMMEHVTFQKINEMIDDLSQPDAFPDQDPVISAKKIEKWLESRVSIASTYAHENRPRPLMLVPTSGRSFK
jgi:histidine decarboxylase